jgi:hypothetical protein
VALPAPVWTVQETCAEGVAVVRQKEAKPSSSGFGG